MKKIQKTITITLSTILVVGAFYSCKKYKLNRKTTTSEDQATAQAMFDDVYNVVQQNADQNQDSLHRTTEVQTTYGNTCGSVTITPGGNTYPKTMTVDFGSTNCEGIDGVNRRGKVIAVFSGPYRQSGTTITITTDNYYVNDYKVDGTKTVTNNGQNSSGHTTYSIQVDGTVTSPDNTYSIDWHSTRTREWVEGENTNFFTPDGSGGIMGLAGITDDAYDITGSGHGTNQDGRTFTVTITEALHWQFCSYVGEITKGKLEIQPEGLKKREVDFGDGNCDNEANVKIGNRTYTVHLR